jgi:hypothetical protein
MADRPATKARIVALLADGWQLGWSNSGRGGARAWMQRELCCGGGTVDCHMASFYSLRDKEKAIVLLPKQEGDAFWLVRYGLKDALKSKVHP